MRRLSALVPALAALALPATASAQPEIIARAKPLLELEGLRFKDLNASGTLEPYEDWRLPPERRAADLVKRMTLAEKAGMMLIATNNPDCSGGISEHGRDLIDSQKMTRFILRARVVNEAPDCSVQLTGFALRGGYPQTVTQMAGFTNAVQERLEAARLGIPACSRTTPATTSRPIRCSASRRARARSRSFRRKPVSPPPRSVRPRRRTPAAPCRRGCEATCA